MMVRKGFLLWFGFVVAFSVSAQSSSIQLGQKDYEKGDYISALSEFQKVLADPEERKRPDGYLWIAKTYFVLLDTKSASENLDYYLQNFPSDPQRSEGLYLQARILFADGDYSHAIEAFGSYLDEAPDGVQVSNALFWMGESAFSLGHYPEAASLYTKVVQGYPTSFKVEAARYRLSLIDLQKREEELLKLLQWSHAEALNAADQFSRRERAYLQEVASYQKQILELKSSDTGAQIASLEEDLKQKDAVIAALKATSPSASVPTKDSDTALRVLELKVKALIVKSALLQWKVSHGQ